MKRILFSLFLVLATSYANEKNGFFIGLEIGGGESTIDAGILNVTRSLPSYGVRAGYSYLFNEYIGLRGYGSIVYTTASEDYYNAMSAESYKDSTSLLSYTINADVLFNFYNTESIFIAAFAGIGIGGANVSYYDTSFVDRLQTAVDVSKNNFYSDSRLGLRAGSGSHSVDFAFTLPLVTTKISAYSIEAKVKQNYRVSLAYNYTF